MPNGRTEEQWKRTARWLWAHVPLCDLSAAVKALSDPAENGLHLPTDFDITDFSPLSSLMLFVELRYIHTNKPDLDFMQAFLECLGSKEHTKAWRHSILLASMLEQHDARRLLRGLGCSESSVDALHSKSSGDVLVDFLGAACREQLRGPEQLAKWELVLSDLMDTSCKSVSTPEHARSVLYETLRFDLVEQLGDAFKLLQRRPDPRRIAGSVTSSLHLTDSVATRLNVSADTLQHLSNTGLILVYVLQQCNPSSPDLRRCSWLWSEHLIEKAVEALIEEYGGAEAVCRAAGAGGLAGFSGSGDGVVDVVWGVVQAGLRDRADQRMWKRWLAQVSARHSPRRLRLRSASRLLASLDNPVDPM